MRFDGTPVNEELHPLEWSEDFQLRHPDGTPFGPHEAPLLRALRGETVHDVELQAGRRMLLANGGPVLGPHGRRLGAVVVNADLTAFREAEGRLRLTEERHRRVLESMSDCVFETDHVVLDTSPGRGPRPPASPWRTALGGPRGSSCIRTTAPSTRVPSRRC